MNQVHLKSLQQVNFEVQKINFNQQCHPQCQWQCDNPQCDVYLAICQPVCETPKCQTRCKEPNNAICEIKCQNPECEIKCPEKSCSGSDCPSIFLAQFKIFIKLECITVCKQPKCVTHCQAPKPECEAVCQTPKCDWKCHKPECPKPKCELKCETPECKPQVECCKCQDESIEQGQYHSFLFKNTEKNPRCCQCQYFQ